MSRWIASLSVPLLALLLASCEQTVPRTQVIVVVRSDLMPGRDIDTLEVRLLKRDDLGNDVGPTRVYSLANNPKEGQRTLPLSFAVEPKALDSQQDFRLVVTGLLDDEEVVEQQAIASFRPHKSLELVMFLARGCVDLLCREDGERTNRSCDPDVEACESVEVSDDLPEWQGGGMELGDGGVIGAGRNVDGSIDSGRHDDPDEASIDGGLDAARDTMTVDAGVIDAGENLDGGGDSTIGDEQDAGPGTGNSEAGVDADESASAELQELSVSGGQLIPAFDPEVFDYKVYAGIGTPTLEVLATPVFEEASVSIDGQALDGNAYSSESLPLNEEKTFTIDVATNGESQRYQITVLRSFVAQTRLETPRGSTDGIVDDAPLSLEGNSLLLGDPSAGRASITTSRDGSWGGFRSVRLPTGERATAASYGRSVAKWGEWLAIGAPGTGLDEEVGAVHLFRWMAPDWRHHTRLDPTEPSEGMHFGTSLSMAEGWLAIGSPSTNSSNDGGHVQLFHLENETWSRADRLSGTHGFGSSVSIESDFLAVGSPTEAKAYVFQRAGNEWRRAHDFQGSEEEPSFGFRVAMSDGRLAVPSFVGCFLSTCDGRPRIHIYDSADSWSEGATLGIPDGPDTPIELTPIWWGTTLAFQGNNLVVGALGERHEAFGINPPYSGNESGSGAAYVFVERETGAWEMDAYIKAPESPSDEVAFGWGVTLDNGRIAIGSFEVDDQSEPSGRIHVFGPDCTRVPEEANLPGCP